MLTRPVAGPRLSLMRAPVEQVAVRAARPSDLPVLGGVWRELMQMHEGADDRFALAADALERWHTLAQEMIFRDDGFLLSASIDGRLVGFCLGWVARTPPIYETKEVGFISEIAVTVSARRRGIGSALVDGARRWFAQKGLTEFQLSTAVWNESARGFWEAIGGHPLLVRYQFEIEQGER